MAGEYLCGMSGDEFRAWPDKAITLMGMSGVGKTTLSKKLPECTWFHYSGDYRIGTRYLNEPILDNIKREAMKVPFLAELLRSDSIYICSNITTANLDPLSSFLGKIGNPDLGGIPLEEFKRRQDLHHKAEVRAMYDVAEFMHKARDIYGYHRFVNDAGGSLCELDEPELIKMLARRTLIVYLKASDDMRDELIRRALKRPKPLYYQPDFLDQNLKTYMDEHGLESTDEITPDDFSRWIFPRLVAHRLPLYENIASRYGVTVSAACTEHLKDENDVIDLIADALDQN